MANLIVAKDVSDCHESGQTICHIAEGTIITPAAKDEAKKYGISFEVCRQSCPTPDKINEDSITSDEIVAILKKMLLAEGEKTEKTQPPYRCVSHANGLKVVRGATVRMDDFDTGNLESKVGFQELVSKDESKMSAGFLTIDHSSFAWKLPYEEIDYVISGTVSVEIDGQTYVGREGDVIFVPSGSDVVWGSPDCAKIFYTTYPSNWADLM